MSEKDVRWFLTVLAKTWSMRDPKRLAALHDTPCVLSNAMGNRVLRNQAEAEEAFTKVFAFYQRFSVAQVELVKADVSVPRVLPRPTYATVEAQWRLWSAEGLPVLVFTTSQILRRVDQGWKVTATASHDEPQQFQARAKAMGLK